MRLASVNLGSARDIASGARVVRTGIFKVPVPGPVEVRRDGLEGDLVADVRHHGGPDQAVYVYGGEDLAWWAAELGRPIEPGSFGENLTVEGLASAPLSVGDRLHIGGVVLEITAPRIPCGTFAVRMGEPEWVNRFRAAERPGVYCRVAVAGAVSAGMAVELEPAAVRTVSVLEMFRLFYVRPLDAPTLRRLLAAPVAERARLDYEEQLAALA